MMEFWPEHLGCSPLYSRFGTVPGRNCAHNYHDSRQTNSYPFSYGELQNQGRESSYWTLPRLRTGSASWTDPEFNVPSSSRFPLILDRQTQRHQDTGVYQPYEVRGREWTAAQRRTGDYERGFQREGWQRRWEPSGPFCYRRESSTKRNNNSYRELEAWANQYSHSLPRRRNREEELRGASHGLLESSGATERSRTGTNPQVALLQQVRHSVDTIKSGGGREQTPTCQPLQAPAPDTSHTLGEKAGYDRRMFSHPPGYTAPPPYNSPHKCTPLTQHSNTSREQEGKRQTYWSQPTLQDKGELTKPDGNQTCAQLEGLEHRTPGTGALKAGSPIYFQNIQQHPQIIQALQNTKATEQHQKVIEGRKFHLNKKKGGMTIFCLVSRIAEPTETPSWAPCTSQANAQTSEPREVSTGQRDSDDIHPTQMFADEVDSRVAAVTEQSIPDISTKNVSPSAKEIPICTDSNSPEDSLSKRPETGVASPEKKHLTSGRQLEQCAQTVPNIKYPLWKEPSFLSRPETENATTFLKANVEKEEESGGLQSSEKSATAHPINDEVRRLDIKRDSQSEDSESLLVIDTTCVVKMEMIPPAKKEHVHYLSSTIHTGENPLHIESGTVPEPNGLLKTEGDSQTGGGDVSFTCKPSSSSSESETLVDSAERTPGIPLHDSTTEKQREEAPTFPQSCVEMAGPSSITNDSPDGSGHLPVDNAEDQVQNEDSGHFAGSQENVPAQHEEKDNISQLKTNIKTSQETKKSEDSQSEPTGEKGTTEQNEGESPLVFENDPSLQPPNLCKDLSKSSLLSHSNLTSLSFTAQSTTEEDVELAELDPAKNLAPYSETAPLTDATSHQQTSPPTTGSTKSSPSSTPHTYHSPRSSPDLINRSAETSFDIEDKDDKSESSQDDVKDASKELEDQEVASPSSSQLEFEKPDNDTNVEESKITDEPPTEADSDSTDLLELAVEPSKENAIAANILQEKAEEDAWKKVSHLTEEQPQRKGGEDSTGLLKNTGSQMKPDHDKTDILLFDNDQKGGISCGAEGCEGTGHTYDTSNDNTTDCQTGVQVKLVQNQFLSSQEETDSLRAEEPSEIEYDEEQENAADCPTQVETEILQNSGSESEPSGPDCKMLPCPDLLSPSELCSPPHTESNIDHFSDSLELDSACGSALNPINADVDTRETISHSLPFHFCEKSSPFSSSSTDELSPNWTSVISTPPHEGGEGGFFDLPHKEHQHPTSLWDAVNRIRKHTAPDSENEEEEISEQWGPESIRDGLGCPHAGVNVNSETVVDQDPCCKEQSVEEDALSCSSHSSGDTLIVTEDENEEIQLGQVFAAADGGGSSSGEVNDETAAKEEGEDEPIRGDMKELCPSEETSEEDKTEMEQK